MDNVSCPNCSHSCNKLDSVVHITDYFTIYMCFKCEFEWAVPRKEFKAMSFVVIRDDNNRILTSIEQAVHVAEKLAAENPSHKYYIAKLIKESKASNVITTDIE